MSCEFPPSPEEPEWYPGICYGPVGGYSREAALASVGAGWAALVGRAWDAAHASGARVTQVKEKFGGLRVYVRWDEDEAAGIQPVIRVDMGPGRSYAIRTAASAHEGVLDALAIIEEESMSICERCGLPGRPTRAAGWIKTLCGPHENAAQDEDPRTDPSVAWDPQVQPFRSKSPKRTLNDSRASENDTGVDLP